jgi:hypothetical protein
MSNTPMGPKEEQVKALRLAREKRWKAKGTLARGTASIAELREAVAILEEKPVGTKLRNETPGTKLKHAGGRPRLGAKPLTAAERKRRYQESLKHGRQQKG